MVKHRAATMQVDHFMIVPQQSDMFFWWADRIAQGDPAGALHIEHHKSRALLVKEKIFVPHQGQVGFGRFLFGNDFSGQVEVFFARQLKFWPGTLLKSQDGQDEQGYRRREGGSHEAGRIGIVGKMPPKVVRILDVFMCEPPKPDHGDQGHRDTGKPGWRYA